MATYFPISVRQLQSIEKNVSHGSESNEETESCVQEKWVINKVVIFQFIFVIAQGVLQISVLVGFGLQIFEIIIGYRMLQTVHIGIVLGLYFQLSSAQNKNFAILISIGFLVIHWLIFSIILLNIIWDIEYGINNDKSLNIDTNDKYILLGIWVTIFIFNVYISLGCLVNIICFCGMLFQDIAGYIIQKKKRCALLGTNYDVRSCPNKCVV